MGFKCSFNLHFLIVNQPHNPTLEYYFYLKELLTGKLGLFISSAVKNTDYSCRVPGFSSHHPHGKSQSSVPPVPGDSMPYTGLLRHQAHTHKINKLKKIVCGCPILMRLAHTCTDFVSLSPCLKYNPVPESAQTLPHPHSTPLLYLSHFPADHLLNKPIVSILQDFFCVGIICK